MIRILLNIKTFSPFLRTVAGEVVIEHVDFREMTASEQVKPVLNFNFSYKPNSRGYSYYKGVDNSLFEVFKPQVETMINSYVSGMNLAPHAYSWIRDSANKSLKVWLKEKGITHEITKNENE